MALVRGANRSLMRMLASGRIGFLSLETAPAACSSLLAAHNSLPPAASACASAAGAPLLGTWAARSYSKAAKKGGKKAGGSAAVADADAGAAGAPLDLVETRRLMERAVDHLQHELANIRTGRATPGMLDHLRVDLYGEKVPLKAAGTVSVRDAQLLAVTVFDPSTVTAVRKAVEESTLQLSARVVGQEVLVPVPRPTSETLAAMAKVCKQQAETAKVTVRHARQLAMQSAKAVASEDDKKRLEKEVQKLTDDVVASIDKLVADKERSIRDHSS